LNAGGVEIVCFLGVVLPLSDARKIVCKISIHILYVASKHNFQSIRGYCQFCIIFAWQYALNSLLNIRLTVPRGNALLPHGYGVLTFSTITSSLQREPVPPLFPQDNEVLYETAEYFAA
jgi:hypothetical protein